MSVSSVPNAAWAVGFVTKSCSISSMYASAEAALVSVGASEMSAMTLKFVYAAPAGTTSGDAAISSVVRKS
jgi:hypothetical protein